MHDINGHLLHQFVLVVDDENLVDPGQAFKSSHVLYHLTFPLSNRVHRLVSLPYQSALKLINRGRLQVDVVDSHSFLLLPVVQHADGLLEFALDQGYLVVVDDLLHVAYKHT